MQIGKTEQAPILPMRNWNQLSTAFIEHDEIGSILPMRNDETHGAMSP